MFDYKFAWMRSLKGPPMPEKFDAAMMTMDKEALKRHTARVIPGTLVLLTDYQWRSMSLADLAAQYPLPAADDPGVS